VELEKVWSDQLPGVKVNFMPDGTGWAEKGYIFMSVRADGKAYVKADVETSAPELVRDLILWRLAKKNTFAPEAGSSTLDAATKKLTVTLVCKGTGNMCGGP
jgi:hypothetical protein